MEADDLCHGVCVGGPLDGTEVALRTGNTFLAADKAAGKAWVYRQQDDGTFVVVVDHDNTLNYPHGATTGERSLDAERVREAGEQSLLPIIAVSADD
jgi:hypothetical protein